MKLGTNNIWVTEIQVCSHKGPVRFHMGHNYKNVKIGWGNLKIFSRIIGPEKLKFT
jgi:hypothetical protein